MDSSVFRLICSFPHSPFSLFSGDTSSACFSVIIRPRDGIVFGCCDYCSLFIVGGGALSDPWPIPHPHLILPRPSRPPLSCYNLRRSFHVVAGPPVCAWLPVSVPGWLSAPVYDAVCVGVCLSLMVSSLSKPKLVFLSSPFLFLHKLIITPAPVIFPVALFLTFVPLECVYALPL